MYEYKVLTSHVYKCEETFNQLAKDGWRLVSMVSNLAMGIGVIAVFEKQITVQ